MIYSEQSHDIRGEITEDRVRSSANTYVKWSTEQTRVYHCLKNNLDWVNSEVLVIAVCNVNFREKVFIWIWVSNSRLRRYIRSHFVFKNGQLILTFSTKRQIPLTRVLYALRRVKFEGSSMGRKPFLWKITSSRVADLSRLRSKAPYCKHETANRITCNKVAALRKTRSIFAFCLSTIESQTIS